jgi:hypothetical protein
MKSKRTCVVSPAKLKRLMPDPHLVQGILYSRGRRVDVFSYLSGRRQPTLGILIDILEIVGKEEIATTLRDLVLEERDQPNKYS